jgi:hypothetical protein
MALYVQVVSAERSVNDGIRMICNLMDDVPNPDALLESRDITLQFPTTGTNAEKRAEFRADFDSMAARWIERRETADANSGAIAGTIVGYRYPAA